MHFTRIMNAGKIASPSTNFTEIKPVYLTALPQPILALTFTWITLLSVASTSAYPPGTQTTKLVPALSTAQEISWRTIAQACVLKNAPAPLISMATITSATSLARTQIPPFLQKTTLELA